MKKYLVPIILVLSCQPPNKAIELESPADTILTEKTFRENQAKLDSISVSQINEIKLEVFSTLFNFNMIVRVQEDGECFGVDSLYYNDSKELVALVGRSGCLVEILTSRLIFNGTGLVYGLFAEEYDGLIAKETEIYFSEGKPIWGSVKNSNWDFTTRQLIDSKFATLSVLEIENDFKRHLKPEESLRHVLERIWLLKGSTTHSDRIFVKDSLQEYVESLEYTMDSLVYRKLIE